MRNPGKRPSFVVLGAAGMMSLMSNPRPALANPASPGGQKVAVTGAERGVPSCSACHGATGAGQLAAGIPRLAGLSAPYILAQLEHFRHGTRESALMTPYAKKLTPAQMREVAKYYASLPVPPPTDAKPTVDQQRQRQIVTGRNLAENGIWQSAMPACAACHGETGLGVGTFSPDIAGQSAAYIADQLNEWKSNGRRDPMGVFMRAEAQHLSKSDIKALAAYYASLPSSPPAKGATK